MTTIKDIANKCGVSIALVSKALNDYDDVNPKTKERILKAAQELGYYPNSNARNLAKSNSNKIAIILRANDDSRFIDEINMIYAFNTFKRANEQKLEISLIFSNVLESKTPVEISNYLRSLGITGILLFGLSLKEDTLMHVFRDDTFKKVLLDIPIYTKTTSSVTIDNIKAQHDILNNNYDKDIHKRICYIRGPENDLTANERTRGIDLFAHNNELKIDYFIGNYRDDIAYDIAKEHPDYDAYICANDMMAIGVKKYFQTTTKDPLITGFDGIKLLEYLNYDFPTVKQDFKSKAEMAIDTLVSLFENEETQIHLVDYELVNSK